MNRSEEIKLRKLELRTKLQGTGEVDLVEIEKELRKLEDEEANIEKRNKLAAEIAVLSVPATIQNPIAEQRTKDEIDKETRGKALLEKRSVTVGTSSLVSQEHVGNAINPTFNKISTIVDKVFVKNVKGGESFKQAYEKDTAEGGNTSEGESYSEADTTFGYATMSKSKITAYSEETEEVSKLTAADYDTVIMQGMSKSLRRKLAKEIAIGTGATNHLVGILSTAVAGVDGAIDSAKDISISKIDEDTLNKIIFGFGGDEDVESAVELYLNKKDLEAFANVKSTDGKKVYKITKGGNTGKIAYIDDGSSVDFVINSNCPALSLTDTVANTLCMFYGPATNYQLTVFSDVEVGRSADYKFKEGMIAHKGSLFVGGNVVAYNGFARVKKIAQA